MSAACDMLVTDAVLKSMVIYPSKIETPFPRPGAVDAHRFFRRWLHELDITNVANWSPPLGGLQASASANGPFEPRGSHCDRGRDRHPGKPDVARNQRFTR